MASNELISRLEARIKALEEKHDKHVETEKGLQQQVDKAKQELVKIKSTLFTHELATGVQFIDVLRALNGLNPGVIETLLEHTKKAQLKLPGTSAGNDPHTIDAFKRVVATLEAALKKS